MSQKFVKYQNKNSKSDTFGKYYARATYDDQPIGTDELADYIQQQATVKKSDVKAVLQELAEAMKHYFELGQKVKLDGIGQFKVSFSSLKADSPDKLTANNIYGRRVIFTPETERIETGNTTRADGSVKQEYRVVKTLVKDVVFEEA